MTKIEYIELVKELLGNVKVEFDCYSINSNQIFHITNTENVVLTAEKFINLGIVNFVISFNSMLITISTNLIAE